jgi:hypothetical protein
VRLGETADRRFYLLARATHDQDSGEGRGASLPIRSGVFNLGAFDFTAVTDGNPETVWATPKPQRGDEVVEIELDAVRSVSAVSLSTGPPLEGYPRALAITTSIDGQHWEEAWSGRMAGHVVEGVLREPRLAEARIAFPSRSTRLVRLRQVGGHPKFGWFIAELKVIGS